jgi:nucleoside-diphosphate-sugar epimerase
VHFAAAGKLHPRIVFISSLSSVLRYKDPETGAIPEHVVLDQEAPQGSDYAKSKWMAELLLDEAAQSKVIANPAIVRLGQIAGPLTDVHVKTGSGSVWSAKEVVPSLVISSKTISTLPSNLSEKDKLRWVPVNACAEIILELAVSDPPAGAGAQCFNVTNMQLCGTQLTWSRDLLPLVKRKLENDGRSIEVVSLRDWIDKVLQYGATSDNPAFRVHDFYEELLQTDSESGLGAAIDVAKAMNASRRLRALGPVQGSWMEHWMDGWGL